MATTVLRIPKKETESSKKQQQIFDDSADYNTLKSYFLGGVLESWLMQFSDVCVEIEDRRILNLIFNELSFTDRSLRTKLMTQKVKKYVDASDDQSLDSFLSSYSYNIREIEYDLKPFPSDECCRCLFKHLYVSREHVERLFQLRKYGLLKFLIDLNKCKRFELTHQLQEELKQLTDDNFEMLLFLLRHGATTYFSMKVDELNLNAQNKQKLKEFLEIKKFLFSVLKPKPFKDSEYTVIGETVSKDQLASNALFRRLVCDDFVGSYLYQEVIRKKKELTKEELLSELDELKEVVSDAKS